MELQGIFDTLDTGARIRLNGSREKSWWTITARDKTHVVAVRQAAFRPSGENEYTVITYSPYRYNYVGPGFIRSSLNTLGGGWDINGRVEIGSREILDALQKGNFELSNRRRFPVEWIQQDAK